MIVEIPIHEGGFLLVNWGTATLRVPYEPSLANPGYPIQLQANQIAIGKMAHMKVLESLSYDVI